MLLSSRVSLIRALSVRGASSSSASSSAAVVVAASVGRKPNVCHTLLAARGHTMVAVQQHGMQTIRSMSTTAAENSTTESKDTNTTKDDAAKNATENDKPAANDPKDAKITELETRVRSLQETSLRALADVENMRMRSEKRVQEAHKFALAKFAKELVGVADVLSMSLSSLSAEEMKHNTQLAALAEGVVGTEKMLIKTFGDFGVKQVAVEVDGAFDPNLHESVFQVPTADESKNNRIAHVLKQGYTLHDRVLRPAQVALFLAQPQTPPQPTEKQDS